MFRSRAAFRPSIDTTSWPLSSGHARQEPRSLPRWRLPQSCIGRLVPGSFDLSIRLPYRFVCPTGSFASRSMSFASRRPSRSDFRPSRTGSRQLVGAPAAGHTLSRRRTPSLPTGSIGLLGLGFFRIDVDVLPFHGAVHGLDAEHHLAPLKQPDGAGRFRDGNRDAVGGFGNGRRRPVPRPQPL